MFVSGSESLGNSVPVYCFWFDIFRCPFLKNLFKEFSGFVVYCSVINVLFLLLPFHETAFILYQSVSCLSTTFFIFLLLWSSSSRDSFTRIAHPSQLVNSFFLWFCNSFFFTILSEFSSIIRSEILQFFKIFARMTSACHSLVSVSASEHMVSYHAFSELSMLFLYFAQFRIFWH